MHIVLVGVNHRSCPIEVRERLAFRAEHLPTAYASLRDRLGLSEALILSTCNRVEIYAGVPQLDGTLDRISAFLSVHGKLEDEPLKRSLYTFSEPQSVEHLFTVASGLDSMVVGEAEILHQVKHAYEVARLHGTTGKVFNVLFQKALNAGKTVRAKTAIGRGGVSIGTVAIELSQKIFGSLRPYTVLLIGAGKIGEATLKRLATHGVSDIRIVNRSLERATTLAALYGGQADRLERLDAQLVEADIVMTSTSSPSALISRAQVSALMPQRRHRPLCLIDLGVPRNIEPSVGQLENVYLFDIDDLQGLVTHHHEQLQHAIQESRAILGEKVERFLAWWQEERKASESIGVSTYSANLMKRDEDAEGVWGNCSVPTQ